jgi:hypothetical protein
MRRPRHDEKLLAIDVDLGKLVGLDCIFDCKRMQSVTVLQCPHFDRLWVGDADPYEFRFFLVELDLLFDGNRSDALPVAIEKGGSYGHSGVMLSMVQGIFLPPLQAPEKGTGRHGLPVLSFHGLAGS